MLIRLPDILDTATLTLLRETLADPAQMEAGTATAGWSAKGVKDNLQLRSGARNNTLRAQVEKALRAQPVFMAAARPKRFAHILFSRYEPGMAYGSHVDNALIQGHRTDLSFTVFLSDPADYDGGQLVIEGTGGGTEVKLAAGHLVLYASSTLHRVEPVTRGVRLAVVGWVRSYIRNDAQREILLDLELASRDIFKEHGKTSAFDRLSKAKSNLLRLWVDD